MISWLEIFQIVTYFSLSSWGLFKKSDKEIFCISDISVWLSLSFIFIQFESKLKFLSKICCWLCKFQILFFKTEILFCISKYSLSAETSIFQKFELYEFNLWFINQTSLFICSNWAKIFSRFFIVCAFSKIRESVFSLWKIVIFPHSKT